MKDVLALYPSGAVQVGILGVASRWSTFKELTASFTWTRHAMQARLAVSRNNNKHTVDVPMPDISNQRESTTTIGPGHGCGKS